MRPIGPNLGGVSAVARGRQPVDPPTEARRKVNSRCDAQLGQLFQDLRRLVDLTQGSVAIRLGTAVGTIKALEAGMVDVLPPHGETSRIVVGYASLAGIDPTPILVRLAEHHQERPDLQRTGIAEPFSQGHALAPAFDRFDPAPVFMPLENGHLAPEPAAESYPRRKTKAAPEDASRTPRRRRIGPRLLAGITVPVLLVAALAAIAVNASLTYAVLNAMPEPLARTVRPAYDGLVMRYAREFEGMKWVDIANPSARRTHKLSADRR